VANSRAIVLASAGLAVPLKVVNFVVHVGLVPNRNQTT
jgi:hypothetical protein